MHSQRHQYVTVSSRGVPTGRATSKMTHFVLPREGAGLKLATDIVSNSHTSRCQSQHGRRIGEGPTQESAVSPCSVSVSVGSPSGAFNRPRKSRLEAKKLHGQESDTREEANEPHERDAHELEHHGQRKAKQEVGSLSVFDRLQPPAS